MPIKRVTGIGGIFFKAEDTDLLNAWYRKHLGITSTIFQWRDAQASGRTGHTVWGPFKQDTKYFAPSSKPFMLNYRVENLQALLDTLQQEGVQIVGEVEEYSYGKFGWIMESEGNKIELWQPIDEEYQKQYDNATSAEKVIGIGGVFFEANRPNELKEWYRKHLGFNVDDFGAKFEWRNLKDTTVVHYTQWSIGDSSETAEYFHPSKKPMMFNYIVADLEALVEALKKEGVEIVRDIEEHDHGKFAWVMDLEGHKVELWQP